MLAGDFNGRTGKANDFIAEENSNFIPGGDVPPPTNLPKRQNFDNTTFVSTIMENNYLIFVKLAI